MGSNTSERRSDSKLSTQSARMIINNARSDLRRWTTQMQQMTPLQTNLSRRKVALPQRSARHKRPTPGCYLCDHQIMRVCSGIERQNEQPDTSGEPIYLHHLKRRVACCICRQNSRRKFGLIWLQRLTNARGHLCKYSNHPWLHKNRWWVVRWKMKWDNKATQSEFHS